MKQETQERRQMCRITALAGGGLAVVVLIAMLLAYVGVMHGLAAQTAAAPSPLPAQLQPTSVHIVRFPGGMPNRPIEPLDRTITDSNPVQHLYQTIVDLPNQFLGIHACTSILEVYELTFSRSSRVLLTVLADVGGCGDVDIERPGSSGIITRRGTPAFWTELSQVLGIPQSVLLPAY